MASIEPLRLRLVTEAFADRVPSPAHDSLTPAGRRRALEANPDSYLAVTRSIEDLDPAHTITNDELLALGRASLERLVGLGAFGVEHEPQFFAYQMATATHSQTGLVAGVATADFARGDVRAHEQIHHARAAHLARHLAVVGVQSSPIALAHTPLTDLRAILQQIVATERPALVIESEPGFVQRIWPIDQERSHHLAEAFVDLPLYLIDGHHRGAAAVEHRRLVGPGSADMTLCALFATDELANFAFHRVLPAMIGDIETVRSLTASAARPFSGPGSTDQTSEEIALYDGATQRWWALSAPPVDGVAPSLADLAPTRLAQRFDEAFGAFAADGVNGHRWRDLVRYRPGVLPLDQLVAEADERNDALFVLPSLPIAALIAVANAGLAMPPKSTYFDPKVRSGVFLRHL